MTGSASVYKTIADINSFSALQPDDQILLRKGQIWLEQLTIPTSGTSGHQIIFSNYGTGENPKLIGSDVFSVAGYTLTAGQTNTYEATMATTPGWVWEDTTPLSLKTSISAVESTPGTWWWDSSTQKLYIHAIDNSNVSSNGKIYEKSGRDHNIDTNLKNYIVIDGIDCTRTGGNDTTIGGIKVTGNYTIVRNLTTEGHRRHAASFGYGASNGLFENMIIKDSYVTAAVAIFRSSNNTIKNCDISSPTFATQYAIGVVIHGGSTSNIIENNDIHDSFYFVTMYDDGTDSNILRRNHFYGYSRNGLYLSNLTDGTRIYYNLFENSSNTGGPILVDIGAVNTYIYNNTLYGSGGSIIAITVGTNAIGTKVFNNIISSSKQVVVSSSAISGTEVDYNIYQITGTGAQFQWNGVYYNTFVAWKVASSQDVNSFNANPLFVTAGTDFTLSSSSLAINSGTNTDSVSDYIGASIPQGFAPDIGAYEYLVPLTLSINTPTVLSSSTIRWNFVENASEKIGFRLYDDTNTLSASSVTTNLSYLDEIELTENTEYSGRYVVAYNSAGSSASSSVYSSIYTLVDPPTSILALMGIDRAVLTVDSFPNDTSGQSGYYFSRNGANSGWIQTNSWTDIGLACSHSYTYSVKYRNGDGMESDSVSLTTHTEGCPSSSGSTPTNRLNNLLAQGNIELATQIQQQYNLPPFASSTPNSSSNPTFKFTRDLKLRTTHPEVKLLQHYLNTHGYPVAQTGPGSLNHETSYFGSLTKQALIKFQLVHQIKPAVGYFGPITRGVMRGD